MTRDDLILAHQHLVPITRKRVYPTPPARIAAEDLEGAGYLGLCKAADRYDPARGVAFPSYAIACIRGEMREYLRQEDWAPRSARERERQTGEAPLLLVSLDDGWDQDEAEAEFRHADTLCDPSPGPEALALAAVEREEVRREVSRLPAREKAVLVKRWWGAESLARQAEEQQQSASRLYQLHLAGAQRLRGEEALPDAAVFGWDEPTDAILRSLYPTHYASDIAQILGCNKATVYKRVRHLGLNGSEEDTPMVEAPAIEAPTNGQDPASEVLTPGGRKPLWDGWTPERDTRLREGWRQMPTVDLAAALGCAVTTVRNRARQLDLPAPSADEGGQNRATWQPHEDDLLREKYGRAPTADVCRELGRTLESVRKRAHNLMQMGVIERRQNHRRPPHSVAVPFPDVSSLPDSGPDPGLDPEVAAMQALVRTMEGLSVAARGRVLAWAGERWRDEGGIKTLRDGERRGSPFITMVKRLRTPGARG